MKLNMKKTLAFLAGLTTAQLTIANDTQLGIKGDNKTLTINDGADHTFTAKQGDEVKTLLASHGIELPEDCLEETVLKKFTLIEVGMAAAAVVAVGVVVYKVFGSEGVTAAAEAATSTASA